MKKSILDGLLETRTRGGRMLGADESTELWRHPSIKSNLRLKIFSSDANKCSRSRGEAFRAKVAKHIFELLCKQIIVNVCQNLGNVSARQVIFLRNFISKVANGRQWLWHSWQSGCFLYHWSILLTFDLLL